MFFRVPCEPKWQKMACVLCPPLLNGLPNKKVRHLKNPQTYNQIKSMSQTNPTTKLDISVLN